MVAPRTQSEQPQRNRDKTDARYARPMNPVTDQLRRQGHHKEDR